MNKIIFIIIIVFINLVSVSISFGQDSLSVFNLDENIVVTASRIPTNFPTVGRSIIVIDQDQIAKSGAQTIEQLLEISAGIDLQQRGESGVQADLNIRGATFEQSLILIDGIKMSDPQTGHHIMDIPLTLQDIQKIEILKGQGSRLYGPNAFGGVINIITKRPAETEASISGTLGENRYHESTFSILLPLGNSGHRLSVLKKASKGYRKNTDFDIQLVSYGFNYDLNMHNLSVTTGIMDKQFGANSFYHPAFPNQWERTQTSVITTAINGDVFSLQYSGNLSWRYHTDEFMLNRDNPTFYHNQHFTNVYGFDFHLTKFSSLGNTSAGGETFKETINSNILGQHQRMKSGLFFEHQFLIKNVNLTLGSTLYHYSGWDWQIWPGLDFNWQLNNHNSLFISTGYAFRAPTFTELYYNDPANRGNENLKAEKSWNYELGWRYNNDLLFINMAIFRREGNNLIDWIWQETDSIWQAFNITDVNANGFEFDAKYPVGINLKFAGINSLNMSYTYLDSDKNIPGRISKYIINHFRHQSVLGINLYILSPSLNLNINSRYEDRINFDKHFVIDINIIWQLRKYFKFYINASNVLNNIYKDFHSVSLAGRWIKTGFSFQLKPVK